MFIDADWGRVVLDASRRLPCRRIGCAGRILLRLAFVTVESVGDAAMYVRRPQVPSQPQPCGVLEVRTGAWACRTASRELASGGGCRHHSFRAAQFGHSISHLSQPATHKGRACSLSCQWPVEHEQRNDPQPRAGHMHISRTYVGRRCARDRIGPKSAPGGSRSATSTSPVALLRLTAV
ncbi:hypothetical protein PYCCODRAFT_942443 [Trametes coccinea BRFM310]|uniref:Uncharacterized protein n=1 Tax=Trametes coccinea (strain BRFM310) TaxID=1353009 RepID=A0A1Y2J0S9_TRAC3|nr:hypothetical protein PYCCODRAFT_942443 [Trametes coccinea BRFM310]